MSSSNVNGGRQDMDARQWSRIYWQHEPLSALKTGVTSLESDSNSDSRMVSLSEIEREPSVTTPEFQGG